MGELDWMFDRLWNEDEEMEDRRASCKILGKIQRKSLKAIFFLPADQDNPDEFGDGDWIPLSLIEIDEREETGGEEDGLVFVTMPEWLAREKNFETFIIEE